LALRSWQLLLIGAFALYYVAQLPALATVGRGALRAVWRLIVVYFVVVSPFYSGWYMVWPTAIAALLVERRTTLYTTLLCLGALATYLVQFVLRPVAGPALGASLLGILGVVAATGPFLCGWAWVTFTDWLASRSHLPIPSAPAAANERV
jgi:hypothetical protein